MRAFLLLGALLVPAAQAATCTAVSGDSRNRLLELYTSEGCSSCPPADRWLSRLPVDSGVVPLAFHVDYWDRLGWRDPYAQAAFSQRQRARNSALGWVYTPQLMLDGEDYRGWNRGLPTRATPPAKVDLTLTRTQAPQQIDVRIDSRFAAGTDADEARLYLALYENRRTSTVTAGENAGRQLHHDYVVRRLVGPLMPPRVHHRFAVEPGWKTADLGVAAFALDGKGATLQALALPACP